MSGKLGGFSWAFTQERRTGEGCGPFREKQACRFSVNILFVCLFVTNLKHFQCIRIGNIAKRVVGEGITTNSQFHKTIEVINTQYIVRIAVASHETVHSNRNTLQ